MIVETPFGQWFVRIFTYNFLENMSLIIIHIFGQIVEFVYIIIEHCTKPVLDTGKKLWMGDSEVGLDTSMDEHV